MKISNLHTFKTQVFLNGVYCIHRLSLNLYNTLSLNKDEKVNIKFLSENHKIIAQAINHSINNFIITSKKRGTSLF